MLWLYCISVLLRFTLSPRHFQLAPFFFSITLVMLYFRFLRFMYVIQAIGHALIIIRLLVNSDKYINNIITYTYIGVYVCDNSHRYLTALQYFQF